MSVSAADTDLGWTPLDERPEALGSAMPFVQRDAEGLTLFFELSSVQSRMAFEDPDALVLDYTRAMLGALLLCPAPREVVLIGLGGGSLVKFLHRHLPTASLTVVEINPQVIALREAFQVPPDDARLRTLEADGAVFLADDERLGPTLVEAGCDWLLVDGFDYDGQPEALCTPDFYARCRQRLAPGGVLVVNLQADDDLEHQLLARLDLAFEGAVRSFRTRDGGNRIAFAGELCRAGLARASWRQRWATLPPVQRETLAPVRPALLALVAAAAAMPADDGVA